MSDITSWDYMDHEVVSEIHPGLFENSPVRQVLEEDVRLVVRENGLEVNEYKHFWRYPPKPELSANEKQGQFCRVFGSFVGQRSAECTVNDVRNYFSSNPFARGILACRYFVGDDCDASDQCVCSTPITKGWLVWRVDNPKVQIAIGYVCMHNLMKPLLTKEDDKVLQKKRRTHTLGSDKCKNCSYRVGKSKELKKSGLCHKRCNYLSKCDLDESEREYQMTCLRTGRRFAKKDDGSQKYGFYDKKTMGYIPEEVLMVYWSRRLGDTLESLEREAKLYLKLSNPSYHCKRLKRKSIHYKECIESDCTKLLRVMAPDYCDRCYHVINSKECCEPGCTAMICLSGPDHCDRCLNTKPCQKEGCLNRIDEKFRHRYCFKCYKNAGRKECATTDCPMYISDLNPSKFCYECCRHDKCKNCSYRVGRSQYLKKRGLCNCRCNYLSKCNLDESEREYQMTCLRTGRRFANIDDGSQKYGFYDKETMGYIHDDVLIVYWSRRLGDTLESLQSEANQYLKLSDTDPMYEQLKRKSIHYKECIESGCTELLRVMARDYCDRCYRATIYKECCEPGCTAMICSSGPDHCDRCLNTNPCQKEGCLNRIDEKSTNRYCLECYKNAERKECATTNCPMYISALNPSKFCNSCYKRR